ncbi:brain and acute leukemia cytoplasmic protein isoform X2 [Mus caroli]|uniref:Brain and acute leukemia cytoplasmic protein isoform X2 n=1 Tax=Mus caroli TaxID=10089 RepID=A0A6P5RAS4_MUSCR|nr:brain and acute leukemia cytoplasmic protein isoform X2 [Mus caroli]
MASLAVPSCPQLLWHLAGFSLLIWQVPSLIPGPFFSYKSGVLEDGLSSNGVLRPAAPGGIANPEKKMNCGTQCPNSQNLSSGPLTQKQNGLWATEAKRDAKRMSAREVAINVTENIRQMDRSKRVTKNCVN